MTNKSDNNLSTVCEPLIISEAQSFHLRVPVPPLRVDSQSTLNAWDVLAIKLTTSSGIEGWGYQCGFGNVISVLKIFLDKCILPQLIGQDARMHRKWWNELYLSRHYIGLNGPAVQGVSAPEIAAWDLIAKAVGVPLWMLLGGSTRRRVLCYDTNCGWLGYSLDELIKNVKQSVSNGFRAVKIKIGSNDFSEDLRRIEAVREVVGDKIMIAVDVNNRWDLQSALKYAPILEKFNIAWLEEPIYPFDVQGHAKLAASIKTPLLHGENIYDPLMFRDMLDADAMDIAQPSNMKLGGISRWLEVAALARVKGRRVIPAGWTMMQIDQHLAAATPHCWMIEWIPWILDIFVEPVKFESGYIVVSDRAGASTAIKPQALEKYGLLDQSSDL